MRLHSKNDLLDPYQSLVQAFKAAISSSIRRNNKNFDFFMSKPDKKLFESSKDTRFETLLASIQREGNSS